MDIKKISIILGKNSLSGPMYIFIYFYDNICYGVIMSGITILPSTRQPPS